MTQQQQASRPEISPARLAANRANAKRSTGPRTAKGKARSRRNSWKHGCYSNLFTSYLNYAYREVGDFDECSYNLRYLRSDFRRQYRPCAPEEAIIVDRLALLWHRLSRINLASTRGVRWHKAEKRTFLEGILQDEASASLEPRLERSISRLRKDLAFLQRMRLGHDPRWGIQDIEPQANEDDREEATDSGEDLASQTPDDQAAGLGEVRPEDGTPEVPACLEGDFTSIGNGGESDKVEESVRYVESDGTNPIGEEPQT